MAATRRVVVEKGKWRLLRTGSIPGNRAPDRARYMQPRPASHGCLAEGRMAASSQHCPRSRRQSYDDIILSAADRAANHLLESAELGGQDRAAVAGDRLIFPQFAGCDVKGTALRRTARRAPVPQRIGSRNREPRVDAAATRGVLPHLCLPPLGSWRRRAGHH